MSKPTVSIRFIREAKEKRVQPGVPGHKEEAKRTDQPYEIVHSVGKIMEVSQSSATHWIARGVAEIIGDGAEADTGTLPAAPPSGGIPLPPPPPGV